MEEAQLTWPPSPTSDFLNSEASQFINYKPFSPDSVKTTVSLLLSPSPPPSLLLFRSSLLICPFPVIFMCLFPGKTLDQIFRRESDRFLCVEAHLVENPLERHEMGYLFQKSSNQHESEDQPWNTHC